MANAADIQFVFDNIESDADAHGWTIETVTARLDGGAKPSRVVAVYWRKRASDTLQLVNTSEAGSSRGMDSIYPRMVALADKWDGLATEDETPIDVSERARNGTIVRI